MNPPKMPIHIGDYHRDTGHLRAAEHGAYLLLMFHYWSTGSLPDADDHLAAIARMSRAEWKKCKATIQAFFKDGWKHGRIDYDLEKARSVSDAAREAGKASGRSRSVERQLNGRSLSVEPTIEPLNHKKEDAADAASPPGKAYAFEAGVIRLNERDFLQWKQSYSFLDLGAELLALQEWAGTQRSWFNAVKGALAKRNREAKIRSEQTKNEPAFKWNGMEGIV